MQYFDVLQRWCMFRLLPWNWTLGRHYHGDSFSNSSCTILKLASSCVSSRTYFGVSAYKLQSVIFLMNRNCTFVNGVVKLLWLCFACCPSQLIWVQTRALYAWYKHKFRKLGKTFDCRWHIHLNLGSVCGSPIVLVRYVDSLLALCSVNIWRKCFNSCLQQQQKLTTASRF
jgi:hypothetical protein